MKDKGKDPLPIKSGQHEKLPKKDFSAKEKSRLIVYNDTKTKRQLMGH